jgi:hypothetical protein
MKHKLYLVMLMFAVTACDQGKTSNQATLGEGVSQVANWEEMALEPTNTAAVSNAFLIQMR